MAVPKLQLTLSEEAGKYKFVHQYRECEWKIEYFDNVSNKMLFINWNK